MLTMIYNWYQIVTLTMYRYDIDNTMWANVFWAMKQAAQNNFNRETHILSVRTLTSMFLYNYLSF
jgi:hypothetical protein